MAYFFINTDAKSLGFKSPHEKWFEYKMAFTGGDFTYGERLGWLSPGDTLLMWVNKVGVVGIGEVLEPWDGKTYLKNQLIYKKPFEHKEYRISVEWSDLRPNTITAPQIVNNIGWNPVGSVQRIKRDEEIIAALIAEHIKK